MYRGFRYSAAFSSDFNNIMHRCSVINCTNDTTDKVFFFSATTLPNFEQIKEKLIECKNPRICHIHFEFKWLNLKLKKGAFPTFFETITPDQQYAPDNIPEQWYTPTSYLYTATLPDHPYASNVEKKLEHCEKKLSKAKNKSKVQQSRKRRADKRLISLQEKLGNCLFSSC